MSENVTFQAIVDEATEIQDDVDEYDYYQQNIGEHSNLITMFYKCYYPFLIVIGVPCNILTLLILIRRRLWLHHEAYIYLGAVLIVNTGMLFVVYGDNWLEHIDRQLIKLSTSADIICKLWDWITDFSSSENWLHVLMLLNVYLRQQLITSSDRRGCYRNLAAKYCTLLGTKVVIGSFFTVFAAAHFWLLTISSLERGSVTWRCRFLPLYYPQYTLLIQSLHWIGVILLISVLALILLVVWKRWKSTGVGQMNGATNEDGDAEVTARIAVFCSAVFFVLKIPKALHFIVYLMFKSWHRNLIIQKFLFAIHVIALANPLSLPIVCFAVKSRLRDELRAFADRCCYRCCSGARHHRTLPLEADSRSNSVLQMGPIEEDLPVTGGEEDSEPNRNLI